MPKILDVIGLINKALSWRVTMATLMALTTVLTLFGYFILVSAGAVLVDLYLSDVLVIAPMLLGASYTQIICGIYYTHQSFWFRANSVGGW